MPTPAERHAAARERRRFDSSHVGRFAEQYSFPLDDFQVRGCAAVQDGRGVLVAAPTGSGKTVVGEFACYLALHTGRKTFYTTPIKALSNQKYNDLVTQHGSDNVGLLTGDSSVNGEAPIVVMTTEVLRNMLYAGSTTLRGLGFVVMDEVHYLADRFRGAVWEEVIIHLPESVQVISLSATVSNAEEFGDWLREVRGDTEVIVEEHRPVPLWQHMMVGRDLLDLFVEESGGPAHAGTEGSLRVSPELLRAITRFEDRTDRHGRREDAGAPRGRHGRQVRGRRPEGPVRGGRPGRPGGGPSRAEVIDRLDRDGLLPAITFIFSRVGCDGAVSQLLAWGTQLISDEEGERIRRLVEERVTALPDEDLGVLGYWDFVEGLSRGFAAHHAGMLPTFREIVEELFTQGRIRAVFATETLALGINMPARTVVLERLVKFNGETHADITPAEFTQLTGRAGRRGIDFEGHAVVLHHRGIDPHAVAGLASTRTYPLRSSFVPTSNMAVNLVAQVGRAPAREVLESSFAQFQADRGVVGVSRAIKRNEEALEGYADAMRCHQGDFAEYASLRREISDLEKQIRRAQASSRRAAAERSLEELQPGDVIRVPSGRRAGLAIVIQGNRGGRRSGPEPTLLTAEAQVRRLTHTDVDGPVVTLTRLKIPSSFSARSPKHRRDLAATLRAKVPHDPPSADHADEEAAETAEQASGRIDALRRQLREHPCHDCPYREDHARWAERWWRLRRETDGLERKVSGRTHTVSRTFDRICDLLSELGYLSEDGQQVTEQGTVLQRIYAEKDVLVAECLRDGAWEQLDPASLAAIVSTLVHEPRREQSDLAPRVPNDEVRDAYDALVRRWSELDDRQRAHRLVPTGEPDAGIAWMVHRWVSGARLELVLRDSDLSAGDFVRRCKQLADLLGQIGEAAPDETVRRTARKAIDGVVRGVVAADRLD
ncbi:DEAD/DEAH box helicase [Luteipulveratus flavus]|uniref:DEAD/DEAH box helicase n=1 Tax=Luteipulveratus flavus TaxID=3031728 RepID=A0ABT6CCU0_9MICO|nr:DEAD/DEAH box helicase [Luteipulveratus sp. YIM 133296]MDF8266207.1 DEAD/DEAH box helicase [Luteipulveratus sp. YIM 133296]